MQIAKKTKSPVIVLDENGQEMVILPLNAYEELLDGEGGEITEFTDELFTDDDFEVNPIELEQVESLQEPAIELKEVEIEKQKSDVVQDIHKTSFQNIEKPAENNTESTEEQFYLEAV